MKPKTYSMKYAIVKRLLYTVLVFTLALGFSNCTVRHTHHHKTVVVKKKKLPPGHAKKIHGDKSAKRHAPGQRR